jgi:hypothetical protein
MSIRSETFVQNYSAAVPAAVLGVPGQVTLFTITVPSKAVMRITDFGNYIGTVAAWTFVWWVFLYDGFGLYPYNLILDQIGFGTGRQIVQGVDVQGGHTCSVVAFNNTAGIVNMGISIAYELSYPDQV